MLVYRCKRIGSRVSVDRRRACVHESWVSSIECTRKWKRGWESYTEAKWIVVQTPSFCRTWDVVVERVESCP